MAKKRKLRNNNKKLYRLEDEVLVQFNSILSVKIKDLGIHPEFMSEDKIRQLIASEIDETIRQSFCIDPIAHSIKLVSGSTQSVLKDVGEKQSE